MKVAATRAEPAAHGGCTRLRPGQAHAQSEALAADEHAADDQAFIDTACWQSGRVRGGESWTVAARGAYTGQPRSAVVIHDDRFDATASITICAMTTDPTDAAPVSSRTADASGRSRSSAPADHV
jgi:hypothetical protein